MGKKTPCGARLWSQNPLHPLPRTWIGTRYFGHLSRMNPLFDLVLKISKPYFTLDLWHLQHLISNQVDFWNTPWASRDLSITPSRIRPVVPIGLSATLIQETNTLFIKAFWRMARLILRLKRFLWGPWKNDNHLVDCWKVHLLAKLCENGNHPNEGDTTFSA